MGEIEDFSEPPKEQSLGGFFLSEGGRIEKAPCTQRDRIERRGLIRLAQGAVLG